MTQRPVKITFVTPCFEEGGGERLLVNLLNQLDNRLIRPTIVSWRVHKSHFLDMLPKDTLIYDLKQVLQFRYELHRLIWEMARLLRDAKPDVVMSFLNEWHIALFIALKLSGSRARLILNEQGWITGWLSMIQAEQPARATLVRWLYEHVYLKYADLIICASGNVARDFLTNFKADHSKIRAIYNPIDLEEIKRLANESVDHPWVNKADQPLVVSVGRLSHQKGYKYLIRAFRRVLEHSPVRLLIVADGPQRSELEAMIGEYGLSDHVEIVGYQSNPFKYLRNASVFALPSLTEGFGYVVVEALALGIPVVATDCAGPGEILDNGQGGLLVPTTDERAMAEAISKILRDDGLQSALSERAKRRAEDFSIRHIISMYEEAISEHAH